MRNQLISFRAGSQDNRLKKLIYKKPGYEIPREVFSLKGVTTDVISEVRARANIKDVISETVVLKRAGNYHKGLCPFHKEKTPSFTVNEDKGIFKCFGCAEGGDVFAFVQKIKGINFYEAVRDLAAKYGVALVETEQERQEHDRRSAIFMLYEQATVFYQKLLKESAEGEDARKYLEKRGITAETIEKFRLGYAPNTWDSLLNYLTANGKASSATLAEAGLVRQKQGGTSYFDLFRNRLMIPICDDRGRVIAFGGRTLGDDQVKYLNSPETPIYHKGLHLFGMHLAKDQIREKDSVIVVEGYFDAITPHQFGFGNTVATLGTALTEQQAKLLVRYTESKRVYLSFDADDAGARAVLRGVETLSQIAEGIGIELRVIRVPGGKDPDECLRQDESGPTIFAGAIENAPLMIDYQIEEVLDKSALSSHTGRIEAAGNVVPIISQLKMAVNRMEYIRQLAGRINIREEELLSDVNLYRREHGLDKEERAAMRAASFQRDGNYQGGQGFQRKGGNFKGGGGNYKGGGSFKGKKSYDRDRDYNDYEEPRQERPRFGGLDNKRAAPAGHTEAEKQLLALYLISRDDHKRVLSAMESERLMSPEHQKIKETIEGIGSAFQSIEDLRCQLQDRLAPDPRLSAYLTEIILKADALQKQDLPVDVVVMNCRARILEERMSNLIQTLRNGLVNAQDDGEEREIQTTIITLTRLAVELRSSKSLEELVLLKNKIEPMEAKYIQRPSMESKV